MNYATNFRSVQDEVSREEWQAQVDAMAARTDLIVPSEEVLALTAHLYQPGTRRPYGVLEWPAMLRLPEAEGRNSGWPHYAS